MVACGAIAQPSPTSSRAAAGRSTSTRCRRCCTTSPQRIAGRGRAGSPPSCDRRYGAVAVGYADCGTYGALDEVCDRLGRARGCPALHCYDVFAGAERLARAARRRARHLRAHRLPRPTSFDRIVVVELGLDRYPELRDDYFGHYRRVVWLAQHPDRPRCAPRRSGRPSSCGLPLETVVVGDALLEEALAELLSLKLPRHCRRSYRRASRGIQRGDGG